MHFTCLVMEHNTNHAFEQIKKNYNALLAMLAANEDMCFVETQIKVIDKAIQAFLKTRVDKTL